jgi:hypothetical protein
MAACPRLNNNEVSSHFERKQPELLAEERVRFVAAEIMTKT